MKVLLVAPPGAGKGTQGERIAARFDVPHLATGDLLRDHVDRGTDLGRSVQQLLARGELVPDEVVLDMVRQALEQLRGGGYVLDGVPRTMPQARALFALATELGMTADVVLHLDVDDAELVRRLLARAASQGRADDTEDVVRHRLALYHDVTQPILAWYRERGILVSVDARPPVEQVTDAVLAALERVAERLDERPADVSGLREAFGARPP